jgi:cob(I)alamin adenosyltransferase
MANRHAGDSGTTSLPGAGRVAKSHPRVEACGDLDELCSVLGVLIASLPESLAAVREEIRRIQGALLSICARVAAGPKAAPAAAPPLADLEACIDRFEADLPPLRSFILPGGHPCAAWAHAARAVCRRAERRVAALVEEDGASTGEVLPYLNRLSTYLFCLARSCNRAQGVPETEWTV